MKEKNTAKFFCEGCGAEVPGNSKFCRKCGRFFASVRCPICGDTGASDRFKNGCPTCGYAMPKGKNIKEKNHISRKAKRDFINAIDAKNKRTDGSLPRWSFFLILFVLLLCIAGLHFYFQNT